MLPFIISIIDWSDSFTVGNILTILAVIASAFKLNSTLSSRFAQLEVKVETMWERYIADRNKHHG